MAGKTAKSKGDTKGRRKLKSKIPTIKKMIALDPAHPGSITPQQMSKKGGKKSKKYYIWQSSYHGKKHCERIPDENVDEIKKLIENAKQRTKTEEKKEASVLRAYNKALKELIADNAKIRKENGESALKGGNGKK